LKEGWKKFTKSLDAAYNRESASVAATPLCLAVAEQDLVDELAAVVGVDAAQLKRQGRA
jgi:hypothetical protein